MSRDWGFVYFIQGFHGGPIKIGWTGNVEERLKQLQTGNPEDLYVIASHPAGIEIETRIHRRIAHHRVRGEWFQDCADVRMLIAEVERQAEERLHQAALHIVSLDWSMCLEHNITEVALHLATPKQPAC